MSDITEASARAEAGARSPGPIDSIVVYFLVLLYIMYGGLCFELVGDKYVNLLFPVGIAAVPLVYARTRRLSFQESFPLPKPTRRGACGSLLMTFGILVVVISLSFLVSALFPGFSGADDYSVTNDGFLYGVVFIAVLPAVSEEILCRGLILGGLRGAAGRWPAILLCATMFAFLHLEPFRIPFTFLSGLVITWVAWETRSVILPTLMHFVHNLALFLIMWIAGTVPEGTDGSGDDVVEAVGSLAETAVNETVDWSTTAVVIFFWAGIAVTAFIIGRQQFLPAAAPATDGVIDDVADDTAVAQAAPGPTDRVE